MPAMTMNDPRWLVWYLQHERKRRQGGGSPPLPEPSTVNFTSAQFATGFVGSISTTKDPSRIYGRASVTLWCGIISGSEAKLNITSAWGSNNDVIEVAVNGSAFANVPHAGNLYTLFSGLPHSDYFIEIRYGSGYAEEGYISSTGNVISVTGQPPALSTVSNWLQVGADTPLGLLSCASTPNIATFSPEVQLPKSSPAGTNVGSAKLRGSFTKLYVSINGGARKVGVCKNGGAPIFYSMAEEPGNPSRAIVIPCDGSVSTYNVWDDGNGNNSGHFAVSGNSTRLDIGVRRRMDQFGDSITAGEGASPVSVETMSVASALGFVGSSNGISGITIAQCKDLIDYVIPRKVVTSNDVVILAIGRNNVGYVDATAKADYELCIDKLVAKGYGKILCRAILPTPMGDVVWTTENNALQSVVTAKNNPNVIWIPTSTWLGYGSADNTHPSELGYATLATYAIPAYASALGL